MSRAARGTTKRYCKITGPKGIKSWQSWELSSNQPDPNAATPQAKIYRRIELQLSIYSKSICFVEVVEVVSESSIAICRFIVHHSSLYFSFYFVYFLSSCPGWVRCGSFGCVAGAIPKGWAAKLFAAFGCSELGRLGSGACQTEGLGVWASLWTESHFGNRFVADGALSSFFANKITVIYIVDVKHDPTWCLHRCSYVF